MPSAPQTRHNTEPSSLLIAPVRRAIEAGAASAIVVAPLLIVGAARPEPDSQNPTARHAITMPFQAARPKRGFLTIDWRTPGRLILACPIPHSPVFPIFQVTMPGKRDSAVALANILLTHLSCVWRFYAVDVDRVFGIGSCEMSRNDESTGQRRIELARFLATGGRCRRIAGRRVVASMGATSISSGAESPARW